MLHILNCVFHLNFVHFYTLIIILQAFNFLYVSLGMLMLLTTLVCNVLVIKGLTSMRKK